nr:hypothetical protein NG677_04265 [Methylobacterium sp. OTU13CASTA1]
MSRSRHTHNLIREWPEIRGLQVIALETASRPGDVLIALAGGPTGMDDIAKIDGTEPGAKAKAVSLGDMLHDLLEAAEMGWFPFDRPEAGSDQGEASSHG